jgi:hypothetical protein
MEMAMIKWVWRRVNRTLNDTKYIIQKPGFKQKTALIAATAGLGPCVFETLFFPLSRLRKRGMPSVSPQTVWGAG